jgi:uncharacterized protein
MEGIDSREALTNLIRLQELHLRIAGLQARVVSTPREIAALDQKIEEEQARVGNAAAQLEQSAKERRRLESEVDAIRAKLSHLKDQLMQVKTNEAYQAMLHEIAYAEKQISDREDRIIEEMVAADDLQASLGQEQGALESRCREIESRKRELETFLAESSRELESLRADAERLERDVPPEYLERYRRIAAARGGIAMATIADHCCAACHVRLRPQLIAEVRAQDRIVLCESCNRILYYHPSP